MDSPVWDGWGLRALGWPTLCAARPAVCLALCVGLLLVTPCTALLPDHSPGPGARAPAACRDRPHTGCRRACVRLPGGPFWPGGAPHLCTVTGIGWGDPGQEACPVQGWRPTPAASGSCSSGVQAPGLTGWQAVVDAVGCCWGPPRHDQGTRCQSSQPKAPPDLPSTSGACLRGSASMVTCVVSCVVSAQSTPRAQKLLARPSPLCQPRYGWGPKSTPRDTPACKPPSLRLLEATLTQGVFLPEHQGGPALGHASSPQGGGSARPPSGGREPEETESCRALRRSWGEAGACGGAHPPMNLGHLTAEQHILCAVRWVSWGRALGGRWQGQPATQTWRWGLAHPALCVQQGP